MIYGLNEQQASEEAEIPIPDNWMGPDPWDEEPILYDMVQEPLRGQCHTLCACMYKEDHLGQSVCKRCNGDVYGCECPYVHSILCRAHPDNECDFCHKGMRSSEAAKLCIQCKEDGIGRRTVTVQHLHGTVISDVEVEVPPWVI